MIRLIFVTFFIKTKNSLVIFCMTIGQKTDITKGVLQAGRDGARRQAASQILFFNT